MARKGDRAAALAEPARRDPEAQAAARAGVIRQASILLAAPAALALIPALAAEAAAGEAAPQPAAWAAMVGRAGSMAAAEAVAAMALGQLVAWAATAVQAF